MSVTINASTSAGLIITPDTSGNIQLQYNGVAAPAFSVYYSGGTSNYSGATWTKIALNAEDFDTANCFDSTTNYRFTPNVAGYYQINLCLSAAQNGSSTYNNSLAIYKNGSIYKGVINTTITGQYYNSTWSGIIYFNGTTDYIEAYTYMNTGQGQYLGSTASYAGGAGANQTFMTGCLLRGT